MDIISINVSKLMTSAATADATPEITVATTGVPVNGNIWLSDLRERYSKLSLLKYNFFFFFLLFDLKKNVIVYIICVGQRAGSQRIIGFERCAQFERVTPAE